jgi:hypothetical protein
VAEARFAAADAEHFHHLEGDLDVHPGRESLSPSGRAGRRPPRDWHKRAVVATRAPHRAAAPRFEAERSEGDKGRRRGDGQPRLTEAPPPRMVERSPRSPGRRTFERPPFSTHGEHERAKPPPAPRYRHERGDPAGERAAPPVAETPRRDRAKTPAREPAPRERATTPAPERAPRERTARPAPERAPRERATKPAPERAPRERATTTPPNGSRRRSETGDSGARERRRNLPGEPANRVYRQRESRAHKDSGTTPPAQKR